VPAWQHTVMDGLPVRTSARVPARRSRDGRARRGSGGSPLSAPCCIVT
jgi:hypothetical protein